MVIIKIANKTGLKTSFTDFETILVLDSFN